MLSLTVDMENNMFCNCRRCKKLRKKDGLVLGSRLLSGYEGNHEIGFQYTTYSVSAYVEHVKFKKGRARKSKNSDVFETMSH